MLLAAEARAAPVIAACNSWVGYCAVNCAAHILYGMLELHAVASFALQSLNDAVLTHPGTVLFVSGAGGRLVHGWYQDV